jgi:hypothetical protein
VAVWGLDKNSYISRLHLVGISTLAVVTIGLGLFGWALRPASGGFSPVPTDLAIYIPKAPQGLVFHESLNPTAGGGAELVLIATLQISDVPQEGAFTMVVENLGAGILCTPSRLPIYDGTAPVLVPPQHVVRHVSLGLGVDSKPGRDYTLIKGTGPFRVHLCWPAHGPAGLDGAYLNARFPPIEVYYATGDDQKVALQLSLDASDNTADYTVQSLQTPTKVLQTSWEWTQAPTSEGLPSSLAFNAVNTSETQHDTYNAFISGVLFGVAGGALIAIVQEFVAPFRSRRELRPPEPGG